MRIRWIVGVSACILLVAIAGTAQVASRARECAATPESTACLPAAPSTVRPAEAYAGTPAIAHALPLRPLSPAERPYRPLTSKEKFRHFAHSLYSPYTFVTGVYDAAWNQATGVDYAYGGGMQGFGKRVGAAYASAASSQFYGFYLFPTLLHQDPRYFPLYHASVLARVKHALIRVAVTRADDGRAVLNTSGLLGIAASSVTENAWLPAVQRTPAATANRFLGSLQGTVTGYLLREFTPDIMRIFERHSPKSLRKVEKKIPAQILTGTPSGDE